MHAKQEACTLNVRCRDHRGPHYGSHKAEQMAFARDILHSAWTPDAKKAEHIAPASKKAEQVAPVVKKAEHIAPVTKLAEHAIPAGKKADQVASIAKKAEQVAPVAKKAEAEAPTDRVIRILPDGYPAETDDERDVEELCAAAKAATATWFREEKAEPGALAAEAEKALAEAEAAVAKAAARSTPPTSDLRRHHSLQQQRYRANFIAAAANRELATPQWPSYWPRYWPRPKPMPKSKARLTPR